MHVGRNAIPTFEPGKLPAAYSIQSGKVVSSVGDTPFELTFYKLGDTYYAARNNEFGYANYRIMTERPVNLITLGKREAQGAEAAD